MKTLTDQCRNCFNLHDANHFYLSNFTLITWQINVHLIKSSIKTFEEIDSFSKLINIFIAHLSRRLKWAFLIKICPLSVVVVVVNFSHFHLLLKNHWANFNQTWHKVSLGEGDSSLLKSAAYFQGEIITKYWKYIENI